MKYQSHYLEAADDNFKKVAADVLTWSPLTQLFLDVWLHVTYKTRDTLAPYAWNHAPQTRQSYLHLNNNFDAKYSFSRLSYIICMAPIFHFTRKKQCSWPICESW